MELQSWENIKTQIDQTAIQIRNSLSSSLAMDVDNKYIRTLSYLLSIQHEDGSWGSNDYPIQKPCFTAYQIELLLRLGFSLDSEWEIKDGASTKSYTGSLRRALDWLMSEQQEDGSWGEDLFDCCQVLRLLLNTKHSLQSPIVRNGVNHLREVIDAGWLPEKDKHWFGPAFHAAAIEVLYRISDDVKTEKLVEKLVEDLWELQDPKDGKFPSPQLENGGYRSDCEWHTANTLIALNRVGLRPPDKRIVRAVEWLRSVQSRDGSWGAGLDLATQYCTGKAIIAFYTLEGADSAPVKTGIKWFLDRVDLSGFIMNLSGTIMGAMAFSFVGRDAFSTTLSFYKAINTMDFVERLRLLIETLYQEGKTAISGLENIRRERDSVQETLHGIQAENSSLRSANDSLQKNVEEKQEKIELLEKRISSYWVHLTDKQVGIIGLVLGIAGVIIGILTLKP